MTKILTCLAAMAALSMAACDAPSQPAANAEPSAPAPASPVQKCMNFGGALEAPSEGEWGYTVRQEDMQRLKDAGFDTVRLPVKWSAHADQAAPYKIDPEFLERIDQIVDWSEEVGIQLILNVHHYNELMDDPETHEPRLEGLWDQLASHYADRPQSLIFEFINEPWGEMDVARVDALNARLMERVRQDNPDRWVVVGSAGWGTLDALLQSDPPKDPRIILTFHTYEPYKFTHQGAFFVDPPMPTGKVWGTKRDLAAMRDEGARAAAFRDAHGQPLLVGEFGVYEEIPMDQRARWTNALRQTSESNGFGWCYWDYATTFKVYDQASESWVEPIRAALLGDE